MSTDRHVWIVGSSRAEREAAFSTLVTPHARANCHRRLRGPYSGFDRILMSVVPPVHASLPDVVEASRTEITSVAPELEAVIGPPIHTLTSLAPPEERTRFYGLGRTRRLAHGIADFLAEASLRRPDVPLVLSLENVHAADPIEQELIAILLRRLDPSRVRLMVGTTDQELPAELASALGERAVRLEAAPVPRRPRDSSRESLALAYVRADGTCDLPEVRAAYEGTDPYLRARWHDERAQELERREEWSLRMGAIPWHREHGSDPSVAGGEALAAAAGYCMGMGFYSAALDLGRRGRAVIDPAGQPDLYWKISNTVAMAAAVLDGGEEAEAICMELRERYGTPTVHLATSYLLGVLYTRLHPAERRDHHLAKTHMNNALALASQIEDPAERAFRTVFQQNGLALVEMHLGNLEGSRQLVTQGMERLDRELGPGKHQLHRSVLQHNRANVFMAMGLPEEALADFNAVIEADPTYGEYYLDRGTCLRRLGDEDGALADYDTAERLMPPLLELHYNRADLRSSLGDREGAIADFDYVLLMDPDHVDALINRATLRLEAGDVAGALADAQHGLGIDPGNAALTCTLGLVAMERRNLGEARQAFTRSLELDPALHAALSNRAMVAHTEGDHDAALEDLTRALELVGDDPDLLHNRGHVHQSARHWDLAARDYARALELPGASREELVRRLDLCRTEAGLPGALRDSSRPLAPALRGRG